jgi:hypothetical protein
MNCLIGGIIVTLVWGALIVAILRWFMINDTHDDDHDGSFHMTEKQMSELIHALLSAKNARIKQLEKDNAILKAQIKFLEMTHATHL